METIKRSLPEWKKIAHMQALVTEGMESGPGKRTMEELRKTARKKASSR